jgi:ATP-dependent exoDNAse (exonuclease V) beta subunit
MSRHSSKGLEFPIVAVSEIGSMPADGEHPVSATKLLYVAMTRSTEKLLLTSHRETEFPSQLKQVNQAGIS